MVNTNNKNKIIRSERESCYTSGACFHELYRLEGLLGRGCYSTVREGYRWSNSSRSFAVKCVDRTKLSIIDETDIMNEVEILQELKHSNIIRLHEFFISPTTHYMVIERVRGGELFERIVSKGYYTEPEAKSAFRNILLAVQFCHQRKIAHRDLKPENLLLASKNDDTTIKLADFGYAKKVLKPNSLRTVCGTRNYVAPEILMRLPYDERVDMWSVGIILYILLSGVQPFCDKDDETLYGQICLGEYYFEDDFWADVSTEAQDMIRNLLRVNYSFRLSASQALEHSWLHQEKKINKSDSANTDLTLECQQFENLNCSRRLNVVISNVNDSRLSVETR